MKVSWISLILILSLAGCRDNHIPDVSSIPVELKLERFEKAFFSIDTTNIDVALQQLHKQYPGFLQDFVFNILALPPQPDSSSFIQQQLKYFIRSYKPVFDSSQMIHKDMTTTLAEIEKGLKFTKHYFPGYKVPDKVVTFIGPFNSYGNILTTDALAVGLQLYMGKNYSWYQTQAGVSQYPTYISRRFQEEYIPVNCIRTIIDDIFPDNSASRPLVEQMVQAGKRLYILDQLMLETADTLKTGYTKAQLDGCYANESTIWSFFVQNDLVFSNDPTVIRDYMNDAPKTQAFGEASPGFIGQFVGWQIVKKWMGKNEKLSLQELIATNPKTIFEQAKYKP